MTITGVELTRYDTKYGGGGYTYEQDYNVYFTGAYSPFAVEAATEATDVQTGDTIQMPVPGSYLGNDGAVYNEVVGGVTGDLQVITYNPTLIDQPAGLAKVSVVFGYPQTSYEILSGDKDLASWSSVAQTRDVCFDYSGAPIVNKANQLFSQNAQVPFNLMAVNITGYRNSVTLPPIGKWKYVNSASVTIDGITVPAGKGYLSDYAADPVYVNGAKKYQHRWQLLLCETHKLEVPNMGTVQKVGGKVVPIKIAGQKISTPYPLDNNGAALADTYTASQIVKLTFDITQPYDFSAFNWNF